MTDRPARLNPFRTERIHSLPFLPHPKTEHTLLQKLQQTQHRGVIVGRTGSGKSTLLHQIRRQYESDGIPVCSIKLDREHRDLPPDLMQSLGNQPDPTILCIDGAEQLHTVAWKRLMRKVESLGGCIVTSLHPLPLNTIFQTEPHADVLTEILNTLYEGPIPETSAELLKAYDGDIRQVLRALYDRWADGEI